MSNSLSGRTHLFESIGLLKEQIDVQIKGIVDETLLNILWDIKRGKADVQQIDKAAGQVRGIKSVYLAILER